MITAPTKEIDRFYALNWGYLSGPTASSIPDNNRAFQLYYYIGEINAQPYELYTESEVQLADDFRNILNTRDNILSITRQRNANIEILLKIFVCINPSSIRRYLLENSHLISTLIDISTNIFKFFKMDETLTLEVLEEFEESEPPKIRMTIFSEQSIEETNRILRDFRINWFFKEIDPLNANIMVTLAFK